MGANQSTDIENRRKSALLVLETIKPKIPSSEPSLLLLLNYLHAYVSASSSSHRNIAHLRLNRKLQAYITSASSETAPAALFYHNPPQNPPARFLVQFHHDQIQLGRHFRFVQTCVEDLELHEQVLTAVGRKEVLDLKDFVVERPRGQVGRVESLLKMREELEYSIAEAPVGGYVSMKGMVDGSERKPWWDDGNGNGIQRRKTLTSSLRRPSTLYSPPPDILRSKRPSSSKPLSHSNTVKETRSVGKLAHPGFSYAGMRGASNLADPPSIRGSGPVLPDLSFDDWRGSISNGLKVDTSSCSSNSITAKEEEVLPNVRNSWTSSIYSEKSDDGVGGGGDSYSGGEAGDEGSSGSSGSPSPNSSAEVSPSTAMSSIPSEPPTPTPISPYTSAIRNNKKSNSIPIPLRNAARESFISPIARNKQTVLEEMTDVIPPRNAARESRINPITENKQNTEENKDVISSRNAARESRINSIMENKRIIADIKDVIPPRNAARESRSTPNLNPTLNQAPTQTNKQIPNTNTKILSLDTKDLPPTPGPRSPKRLTRLGLSDIVKGNESPEMEAVANLVKERGTEKGFKGYYPIKQDWEGRLDGVRVCLRKEEVVEVRVESGGSYVKVEAWVPLGSVCDALFSEGENCTF